MNEKRKEMYFKVILKEGKPYLRAYHFYGNDRHQDMRIWKANSDKPYCKYMSGFIGLLYLDEEMIADLRRIQAGGSSNESTVLLFTPEQFAASV